MSDKREKGTDLLSNLFEGAPTGGRLPKALMDYTLEHLFGDVWQQDDLTLQERSLTTCTILIALGREAEQRLHFVGAKNLGVPREKLEAVITHAAHYAGWPVAVSASRVLTEVWPDP